MLANVRAASAEQATRSSTTPKKQPIGSRSHRARVPDEPSNARSDGFRATAPGTGCISSTEEHCPEFPGCRSGLHGVVGPQQEQVSRDDGIMRIEVLREALRAP